MILAAAREEFARAGFDGVSLRGVARVAGVDPALLHHYFDGKDDLFARSVMQVDLPGRPGSVVERMATAPREDLGCTVVATFLDLWDERRETFEALFRSIAGSEQIARSVREFFVAEVAGQLVRGAEPDGDPAELALRTGLVASQMLGLAMARYVLKVPGLVEADPQVVIDRVGPVLQGYLAPPRP